MRKLITTLLVISVICTTSLTIVNASPDTDTAKTQLVDVSAKLKNLNDELAKTTNQINDLESTISTNEISIEEHKKQIENAEAKIDDLNNEIEKNQNLLSLRLREIYKNNCFTAFNYMSFLFKSSSLSDLIDRVVACETIIKEDKKLIENLNTQVNDQNNTRNLISTKKEELENMNKENKDKLNEINDKKNSQVAIQKQLEAEKANLTETITKNELALINPYVNDINNKTSYNDVSNAISIIKNLKPQLSMQTVKDKANEAIEIGNRKLSTLTASKGSNSSIGSSYKVIATYSMQATAYTSTSNAARTASGTIPVYNPSGLSTIAVDPNIIKLGSLVNVKGYGLAIAADTGGAIKGMIIDVYFNTKEQCNNWGRKYNVTVEVLG